MYALRYPIKEPEDSSPQVAKVNPRVRVTSLLGQGVQRRTVTPAFVFIPGWILSGHHTGILNPSHHLR